MCQSINDLPVELLIDIMRYLDQKSLKFAILTCHWWKEVIQNHCSRSIKISDVNISHPVGCLLETNRRLHIELHITKFFESPMIDDFKQIGYRVTALSWENSSLNGLLLLKLLKHLPNLVCIDVYYLTIPEKLDDCELIELKKLKSLETWHCDGNIFKYFRTSNLKSLEIKQISLSSATSLQTVVNFIRLQANLTTLKLLGCTDMFFQQLCQETPNGSVTFKLTKLILADETMRNNCIGLVKFVKTHSETLRKLYLTGNYPNVIYELIFGNLKNLKFLSLNGMKKKLEFSTSFKMNASIENLLLVSNTFSRPALQLVPNVKKLTLRESFDADQLKIISTELRNVTTLFVFQLRDTFTKIKFPKLTSINIELLSDYDWDTFTKANSTITEIIVKYVYKGAFTSDHFETITSNLRLKTFKIGERFSSDERFLSIIHKNCSDLKVLELHRSCGIQDFQWNDGCTASLQCAIKFNF